MQKAITAVEHEGIGLRRAAEAYGIRLSTLHDHVTGQVEHGALPGPSPYLSTEEEKELVTFLIR